MEMQKVKVTREAVQWDGRRDNLPDGFHMVQPEIHWSAGRKFIYFTYGGLQCRHWLGVQKMDARPENDEDGGLANFLEIRKSETEAPYWRKVLPFAFWDVKSEAQMQNRAGVANAYAPVFLDLNHGSDEMFELFVDYVALEGWRKDLDDNGHLEIVEYREVNGSYGRGYLPHYLKKGDWLVRGSEPGGYADTQWHVVSAADFAKG